MFKKIEVPPHLSKLVKYFYRLEQTIESGKNQYLLPSSMPIAGFIYKGSWNIESEPRTGKIEMELPNFYIVGQITCGYYLMLKDEDAGVIGAALQPDALWQIFKTDIEPFTNSPKDSNDIFKKFGFDTYQKKLISQNNIEKFTEIVIEFFTNIQNEINYEYTPASEVVNIITDKKGIIKVTELCELMKLPERYLQRNFKKVIGTSIKDFIRCVKFNNLFTEIFLKPEGQDTETLIYLYSYYDLSHFYKDYKYFFKVSPTKEQKERFHLFEELIINGKYLLMK